MSIAPDRNTPLSTEEIERIAAANAKAPRVSVADIEKRIAGTFYQSGDALLGAGAIAPGQDFEAMHEDAKYTTFCTIVLDNGFRVYGHSTPASPENFDFDLGKKLAYDNAFRQLWQLFGFELRTRLREGW